jgi:uncharacterized damage-inducible protein DinB
MQVGACGSRTDGEWVALAALLEQLRELMALVPVQVYRAQPAARVSGSIGAHVRHTLDHVSALLEAVEGGDLQYDHRARGTTLEVDPATAVSEIERLLYRFGRSSLVAPDRALTFHQLIDPNRPAALVRSTVAREYAFVIQHTIHHCALIAVLLDWQGIRGPDGVGMAPSTRRAQARAS